MTPDPIPRGLAAAAARMATGLGASPDLLTLAHRTIQAMLWNQIRSVAATAALAVTIAAGASGLAVVGAQDPAPPPGPAAQPPPPALAPAAQPPEAAAAESL